MTSWMINVSFPTGEQLLNYEVFRIELVSTIPGPVYKTKDTGEIVRSYKLGNVEEPGSIPLFLISFHNTSKNPNTKTVDIITDGQEQWAQIIEMQDHIHYIIKDWPHLDVGFKDRIRNKIKAKFS